MTWIRVDTDAADSDVVGDLVNALRIHPMQVFGHYIATCQGFAKHRPDGLVREVSDATLEVWARWTGKTGRWATAFRERCTDLDGQVRGWWRNSALLQKQDRDKKKRKPPKNPRGFLGGTPEKPPGYDTTAPTVLTERDDTAGGSTTTSNGVLRSYHTRCVVALNHALAAHPEIGNRRREVSATEMQGAVEWERDNIPVDLVEGVIAERVSRYRPTPGNPQPNSLRYFDAAVRRAWESRNAPPATEKPATTRLRRI